MVKLSIPLSIIRIPLPATAFAGTAFAAPSHGSFRPSFCTTTSGSLGSFRRSVVISPVGDRAISSKLVAEVPDSVNFTFPPRRLLRVLAQVADFDHAAFRVRVKRGWNPVPGKFAGIQGGESADVALERHQGHGRFIASICALMSVPDAVAALVTSDDATVEQPPATANIAAPATHRRRKRVARGSSFHEKSSLVMESYLRPLNVKVAPKD